MAVRREFQFPGDLWLPRRENRCRQPPNNHTSYDYHTPGVYTRAPYLPHSFALSLSLSLSLVRTRALPRPSLFLLTFFISTCLITNSQAYPTSLRLRKIARDLNYCALLLLFLARLELLFVIPPPEIQIILGGANCYLLAVCISNTFRSLFLPQF